MIGRAPRWDRGPYGGSFAEPYDRDRVSTTRSPRSAIAKHNRHPPKQGDVATEGLLVIPSVIPQATTAPNQTGLTRISAQPELPRAYWSGLSGIPGRAF
jgi:hypothetical protein